MNESFGLPDRMKRYEAVSDITLTRRSPVIIRVDGRAFHTLTRGMDRPFDAEFAVCMSRAAHALVSEVQGAKLAYVQSDEVSVLLTDYDTIQTDAWFGYRVQKMVSVAAAIATIAFEARFRNAFPTQKGIPLFDASVFTLPRDEVVNYFVWRQRDAVRNSIQATGQAHFSQKQLHGKNTDEIQEMLFQEKGINWNDTPTQFKRGWCVVLHQESDDIRQQWITDLEIPEFTRDREYIESRLPMPDYERAVT